MCLRVLLALCLGLLLYYALPAWAGVTTRVSVASDGTQGDRSSASPALSADGRYVAFYSYASTLVPGDTNGTEDVFVHDRQTGQTARVSVASEGTPGNLVIESPALSADGRYVAFTSAASNLVPGDTNGVFDVFVHDRQTGQTTRVSVASDGAQGDAGSLSPSLSADGRYVAFTSYASTLVPGDTNGYPDVFVHDRQTGQTARISVASEGTQGDSHSYYPALSADGRYVAFTSAASNLVPGDTNGMPDAFVHDRQTGQTARVSVASEGTQGNGQSESAALSADGRYVALYSTAANLVPGDTNGEQDVFVHDRQTGQTARVSVASDGTQTNNWSGSPALSADGRYVVFGSMASNLVPGDTNGVFDIFVHDRQTGQTARVSVASEGTQGNGQSWSAALSADGRCVAFDSSAATLVPGDTNGTWDVFVHERIVRSSYQPDLKVRPLAQPGYTGDDLYNTTGTGQTQAQAVAAGATATFVFHAQNDGNVEDTFTLTGTAAPSGWTVRYVNAATGADITTQVTGAGYSTGPLAPGAYAWLSVRVTPSSGVPADTACPVTLTGISTNDGTKQDVVQAVTTAVPAWAGVTTRVSVASDGTQGDRFSSTPALSADGRYVAFDSGATNLVPGDTNGTPDVFVHDRQTGQTARVSVASDGTQGNGSSYGPALSADGRYVAFESYAQNLVPGDTNGEADIYRGADVFVHDRQTGQTTRVSMASEGTQANESSYRPALSADGRYVAFDSGASNLVPGDTNETRDVFVHDRQTGQTTRVSVASEGTQGDGWSGITSLSLSAEGRYVAFASAAANLVPGDTNGTVDVFVHDRQTGQTTRVSVASDGTQGNGFSQWLSLSADGRYVAFTSEAATLVPGDTNGTVDVFVHDRQTGQTTRVSVASEGAQGNGASYQPSLSADGRYVAFASGSSTLVAEDTNGAWDVFVHDRQTGQTARVSMASDGTQGNDASGGASLSADGRYVAFTSIASNLVPGDTNGTWDIFVHERIAITGLFQPDLKVRPLAQPTYTGDDLYNTTGAGQTQAQSVTAGATATFVFHAQNDGNVEDTFTLTGTAAPAGWTVRYVNAATGAEITAQITGAGYSTGALAPGAYAWLSAQVTPGSGVPAGSTGTVTLTARSTQDSARQDVVQALTTVLPSYQPDAKIRTLAEASYTGDNLYNTTGASQTRTATCPPGQTTTFVFHAQNDGNVADTLKLTGPAAPAGWTVRYVNAATGADITAQVTGAGYSTGILVPGAYAWLSAQVTPGSSVPAGMACTVTLTATSTQDTGKQDVVKALTTAATSYQPDAKIRTLAEASYTGDNLYTPTGAGQTKAQAVAANGTATYVLHVQNDGNAHDTVTVTGTKAPAGWTVQYYNVATNVEITPQVTGAGYSTGLLAPGAYAWLRIEMTPSSAVSAGASLTATVTATSAQDGTKQDVMKAITAAALSYQPDAKIRNLADAAYTGDNLYTLTGAGQTKAQSVAANGTATYVLHVQNDGNATDTVTVTGTAATAGWTVRYYNVATNVEITPQMTGAGYSTGPLAPGAYAWLRVEMTPSSAVSAGGSRTATVTAASAQDGAKTDVVKATTTRL